MHTHAFPFDGEILPKCLPLFILFDRRIQTSSAQIATHIQCRAKNDILQERKTHLLVCMLDNIHMV